jgi:hypothetical protein
MLPPTSHPRTHVHHSHARAPLAHQVQCLFWALHTLYAHDGPHADAMRREVFDFLMRTAHKYPRFIPLIISLASRSPDLPPPPGIGGSAPTHSGRTLHYAVLEELKKSMMRADDAALLRDFGDVLKLLSALAAEPSIDPSTYLVRLHELLRSSHVCEEGNWEFGACTSVA